MFVGRRKELGKLNNLYAKGKQALVCVYGRRRIGKTVLLAEFFRGKDGIRFISFRGNSSLLFRSLTDMVSSFLAPDDAKYAFDNLDGLFSFVFRKSMENQFVFIIDEYAYLEEAFPETPSILQKYIDLYKENGKLFLILCSSSRSFMETKVMGQGSPLYGRRDLSLKIGPFGISETREMLPLLENDEDIFKVWAITGGIPLYLSLFTPYSDPDEAVKELFFSDTGYFVNEVSLMFLSENRSASVYERICSIIASGASKLSEIAEKAGITTANASFSLHSLEEIDIVKRETSILPSPRKPVWRISDPLVSFWYSFCFPLSSYGEKEKTAYYSAHITEFLGSAYERLAAKALPLILEGRIITEEGRWWGSNPATRKEEEIDIAARTMDGGLVVCECKYTAKDISSGVIETLRRRAELIRKNEDITYIVFTKERTDLASPGFTFYSFHDVFGILLGKSE